MRFSIILISLALLPMMMIFHGWVFTEKQLPLLRGEVLAALRQNGVRSPVVDLRYLDLRIAGDALDLESLENARVAVASVGPLRIVADDLAIPASLRARLEGKNLSLEGWLPDEKNIGEITQLLGKLRPDLTLETTCLKTDYNVRWPEGEKGPLSSESAMLRPIIDKLRVSPWLELVSEADGLHANGIVPANGVRAAILTSLKPSETKGLLESTHTLQVSFADPASLIPFLKSFFGHSSPRRFFINEAEGPLLQAAATRTLESAWLSLLRPVTGGKRVNLNLTLYPSEFHFPDQRPSTPLPDAQLKSLRAALSGQLIAFQEGSTSLSSVEQAHLASLTPLLLTAGPTLRLVVGGHPDPEGDPAMEKNLAKTRADQVVSFLIEQGLPTSDVETLAFDPVPAGTPGAPAQIPSVEILLR